MTARYPPHSQSNAPATATWAEKWALDGEVKEWGYARIPTGDEILAALFALPPIEWNRFTAFLEVTVPLIAERLLLEADRGAMYVQGEVANQTIKLPALTHNRTHHLYCSPHNLGADKLGDELNDLFRRQSNPGPLAPPPLKVTTAFAELGQSEHMVIYLTSATWTSGEESAAFTREVEEAQRLGIHLLLVHEFPSAVEDIGTTRGACNFNDFWNDGWTPRHLLTGNANVYKQIAIALKPGAWRDAGLATVALKMSEGGGERRPINLPGGGTLRSWPHLRFVGWLTHRAEVMPILHQHGGGTSPTDDEGIALGATPSTLQRSKVDGEGRLLEVQEVAASAKV